MSSSQSSSNPTAQVIRLGSLADLVRNKLDNLSRQSSYKKHEDHHHHNDESNNSIQIEWLPDARIVPEAISVPSPRSESPPPNSHSPLYPAGSEVELHPIAGQLPSQFSLTIPTLVSQSVSQFNSADPLIKTHTPPPTPFPNRKDCRDVLVSIPSRTPDLHGISPAVSFDDLSGNHSPVSDDDSGSIPRNRSTHLQRHSSSKSSGISSSVSMESISNFFRSRFGKQRNGVTVPHSHDSNESVGGIPHEPHSALEFFKKAWKAKTQRKNKRMTEQEASLHMEERAVVPFLLDMAMALHLYGAPAHRLEFRLFTAARRYGIEGSFVSMPTAIFMSLNQIGAHPLYENTHVRRITASDINVDKLCKVDSLAFAVGNGTVNPVDAAQEIETIMLLPPLYNRFVRYAALTISSGAIAPFFGVGWVEVLGATFAGFLVCMLMWITDKIPRISRVLEVIVAAVCYLVGFSTNYIAPASAMSVMLAGCCWFLPGLTLTLAMGELATRNLVSGTSRLFSGFLTLLLLGFGLSLGMSFTNAMPTPDPIWLPSYELPLPFYVEILALILCSVCWAILFNSPPKDIGIIFFASLAGYIADYYIALPLGGAAGNFCAAFVIGAIGNFYGRYTNHPSLVATIGGILILVPGSTGLRGLEAIIKSDVLGAVNFGFRMISVCLQLTMGLLFSNILVDPHKSL